ncbi:unnamed protein product [Alopecurus aequalis]
MAPRRSQRLHPQFRGSQEGAGMAPRRSPRIHPQIHASQEGAGTARRLITRLRAQRHAREQGAGVTRLRRCRPPATADPASLPDDMLREPASLPDDMLREILLRLPPQPSSLPRASAVCKRWRGLVADPRFLRRFHAHHRKPPILGVFSLRNEKRGAEAMVFNPIFDPPDRIPPRRISLGIFRRSSFLDCRHGLLLVELLSKNLVVCDPIARKQHRVAVPPELNKHSFHGAVLCAAGDQGHVHGACHSSPFKVVMLYMYNNPPLACVYSSETNIWSHPILSEAPCRISEKPAALVGNCLYWVSYDNAVLEFDMCEHRLAVISGPPVPPVTYYTIHNRQIIQAEDGVVGYAILSYPRFQIWQRSINGHAVATWVPWKTIEIHTILRLPSTHEGICVQLLGYDDDDDAVFLSYSRSVYMVQIKSMQSKKLNESRSCSWNAYFPFKSFFTPAIAGGFNGAEMLQVKEWLLQLSPSPSRRINVVMLSEGKTRRVVV